MTTVFDKYPVKKVPIPRELMASLLNTARLLGTHTDSNLSGLDGSSAKQLPEALPYTDDWIQDTPWHIAEREGPTFLELERPRGTTIVDMNQEGQLVVPAGENGRIATFGLGGCTAVAVLGTFADGSRRAHVQHYSPLAKRHNPEVPGSLEEAMLRREALVGDYTQATRVDAVVMVHSHNHTEPSDPAHAAWLTNTIHDEFGDKASVHVTSYSPRLELGESPYAHTLVVDIPRDGPASIYPGVSHIIVD